MHSRRSLRFVLWLLTLLVGFGIGTAVGQMSPPKDNKGLDAKLVSTVDLAPDLPGHQLRLRKITFEPGGGPAVHSPKDPPALAHILQGPPTPRPPRAYP